MQRKLRDYFVPHKGNDYKPHSLQRAAVLGMAIMIMLTFAMANVQSLLWISSDWLVSTILPAVIVDLTNDERAAGALGSLRRNSVLDTAARLKAEHMAANEYFAHESPDGITPWYWFGEAGYDFVHAGENLAIHFTDSDDVVDAWMDSPTHKANIMNGHYTEIGVGTASGRYQGFDTVFVVQLFGTPAAAATATQAESTIRQNSVAAPTALPVAAAAEPMAESAVLSESTVVASSAADTVVAESDDTVLFLEFVSTSTGGIPATVHTEPAPSNPPSQLGRILTQPHTVLEYVYLVLAAFVTLVLLLAICIEIRRQEPVQVAYAALLLLLMYGLFELHTTLTGGAIVV